MNWNNSVGQQFPEPCLGNNNISSTRLPNQAFPIPHKDARFNPRLMHSFCNPPNMHHNYQFFQRYPSVVQNQNFSHGFNPMSSNYFQPSNLPNPAFIRMPSSTKINEPRQSILNFGQQLHKNVPKISDQVMIEQFLLKCGKLKYKFESKKQDLETKTHLCKTLKIFEARELHCQAKNIISRLEKYLESEDSQATLPDGVTKDKKDLEKILITISDSDVIQNLQKKIKIRQQKRCRIKRQKQRLYFNKQKGLDKIASANKKISDWQKLEGAKLDDQRREKELQKQLDEALLEMRHELSAITKSLEMVNALANLRKLRYNSLKSKDRELPSQAMTKHFNETTKEIKKHLNSYKDSLTNRINSLKLFLETEHEEAKLEIEKNKKQKLLETEEQLKEENSFRLFGKPKELDLFHPMWPVQEVHKQAEINLSNLVQYRHLWDQYLHKDGTSIPISWVEPVAPSHKKWTRFLIEPPKDVIE